MSKEIPASTSTPIDLFENPTEHCKKKALLGSILSTEIPFSNESLSQINNRRAYILRHGERIDFTFGDNALSRENFDEHGNYKQRKDLNLPSNIPPRKNGFDEWKSDSPLTNLGITTATSIGKAMKNLGMQLDVVFSSPAYRCIQTTDAFLRGLGMQNDIQICVDSALFEWVGWLTWQSSRAFADFLSPQQLRDLGYNINLDYKPHFSNEDLKALKDESFEHVFQRNATVVDLIVNNSGYKNALIVAHASNLDNCSKRFMKQPSRKEGDLFKIIQKIPYCSMAVVEEDCNAIWKLVETPPVSQFTLASNKTFDWKILDT